MTEAEWLTCADPARMLDFMVHHSHLDMPSFRSPSDRQLRLFACACCRIHTSAPDDLRVMESLELVADGTLSWQQELIEKADAVGVYWAGHASAPEAARLWATYCGTRGSSARRGAALLRDIFGNPWIVVERVHARCTSRRENPGPGRRIMQLHDYWLTWNDSTVVKIARLIYEERRFEDMPILADALIDAGCDNEEILQHCRGMQREVCRRCMGDGKAHGSDRPFEWSGPGTYPGLCPVCKGSGMGAGRVSAGPQCRRCNGTGTLPDPYDYHDVDLPERCPDCGGAGHLPAVHARGCFVLDLLLNLSEVTHDR